MRIYKNNDTCEEAGESSKPHFGEKGAWVVLVALRLLLHTKAYLAFSVVPRTKELKPHQRNYRGLDKNYSVSGGSRDLANCIEPMFKIKPESWITSEIPTTNNQNLEELLERKRVALEAHNPQPRSALATNLQRIAEILQMSDAERLVALLRMCDNSIINLLLGEVTEWWVKPNVGAMLKEVLQLSSQDMRALRRGKKLSYLGISVDWNARAGWALTGGEHLSSRWRGRVLTKEQLVRTICAVEPKGRLRLADFGYLQDRIDLIVDTLRAAAKKTLQGTHVLLYGPPGTGKTELARAIGHTLGISLWQPRNATDSGAIDKPSTNEEAPMNAFNHYRLIQGVLHGTDRVILMDEAEDFFNRTEYLVQLESGNKNLSKYEVNKAFESTTVPTIWICNSLRRIDPAHLRRFTLIVEMPIPPRAVRSNIFQRYTRGLQVRPAWIAELAANTEISPAHIENVAKVARVTGRRGADAEKAMHDMLEEKLKLSGGKLAEPWKTETPYDLSLASVDVPLDVVVAGLQRTGSGRVCLYGAPGTGKTAFAQYIAQQLGKPLMAKKASDLLSMWVGQTEQLMAQMFERAKLDDAVLLLDEADSFLQDRSGAQRSWEITQVNEMLVQMEHFNGVFLCSSNLIDRLDQAVFRRFDIKIKFGWMDTAQKLQMTRQVTGSEPSDLDARRLGQLNKITPGDFAVVLRRLRVLGTTVTAERIIAGLEEEVQFKTGSNRTAGFAG